MITGSGQRSHSILPLQSGISAIVLLLAVAAITGHPGPVEALPYGWDETWGEPLNLGSTPLGAPTFVVSEDDDGITVHWIEDRKDNDGDLLRSTLLHWRADVLEVAWSGRIRIRGRTLDLASSSAGGMQVLAWTSYDGTEYHITAAAVTPGQQDHIYILHQRSFPHAVGGVDIGLNSGCLIISWEDYRKSQVDVRTMVLPADAEITGVDALSSIALRDHPGSGARPSGPVRFPRVVASSAGSTSIVVFEQQYMRTGTIWLADIGHDARGEDIDLDLRPLVPGFAPGIEDTSPYATLSTPDAGDVLLACGDVTAPAEHSAAGLMAIPLNSDVSEASVIFHMNPRGKGEIAAMVTPGQHQLSDAPPACWLAWADYGTSGASRVDGVSSAHCRENLLLPADGIRNWTFGFEGAGTPHLSAGPGGQVHLIFSQMQGATSAVYVARSGDPAPVTRWNLVGVEEEHITGSAVFHAVQLAALGGLQILANFPLLALAALLAHFLGTRVDSSRPLWISLGAVLIVALLQLTNIHLIDLRSAAPDVTDQAIHMIIAGGLVILFHLRHPLHHELLSPLIAVILFSWWTHTFALIRVVYLP
ncbi:MAG: hypothetical protein R6U70_01745 [Bacillota bacterium]